MTRKFINLKSLMHYSWDFPWTGFGLSRALHLSSGPFFTFTQVWRKKFIC